MKIVRFSPVFSFICSDFQVANFPDPHRDPHGEMFRERRRGCLSYPLRRSVFFAACSHHLCHEITHLFGGALLHLPRDVGVGSQREACVEVTEHTRYGFHVHAILECQGRECVPLRYNYDKPEKPRRIKGFEVFSLIFSSFSKPKNHTEISRIAGGVSLTTNE